MAKTIEKYMTKTRDGYGSGIARPKIDDKAHFELKEQFLKELSDNTFNGSDHEDANEHIEKVLDIVNLFYIPKITQDQIMLRAFPMSLNGAASRWLRNEPSDMQEVILFYNGLEVPTRQILDSKARGQYRVVALGFYQRNHANPSYQERSHLYDYHCDEEEGSYGLKDLDAYLIGTTLYNDALPQKKKDPRSFTLPCYIDNNREASQRYYRKRTSRNRIGFEHVNVNFFLILSINVMSKKFYNSIMKDKVEYNGRNILGTFVNAPIFVGNFSVVTDFIVVENMDAYRDERMGEVIVGEPFCKASFIEARRFDGMITIFNGNDGVTYQMVRSHPRFKH
ncbi:hypothetical protein Tco_0940463 [Tanacetum coccineum]|uniref:Uncharacterized protein n=1 Tax=Tanacetum coccineum TaxID=301880 RepID=A0ABQ5DNZ3_9ASTR